VVQAVVGQASPTAELMAEAALTTTDTQAQVEAGATTPPAESSGASAS
jgi:hypothetical protein